MTIRNKGSGKKLLTAVVGITVAGVLVGCTVQPDRFLYIDEYVEQIQQIDGIELVLVEKGSTPENTFYSTQTGKRFVVTGIDDPYSVLVAKNQDLYGESCKDLVVPSSGSISFFCNAGKIDVTVTYLSPNTFLFISDGSSGQG